MKLLIEQRIYLKGKKGHDNVFTARKTYTDVDFIPRLGDFIEEAVYPSNSSSYKVTSVTINYEHNFCLAVVESVEIDSENKDEIKQSKSTYRSHNWEIFNF